MLYVGKPAACRPGKEIAAPGGIWSGGRDKDFGKQNRLSDTLTTGPRWPQREQRLPKSCLCGFGPR